MEFSPEDGSRSDVEFMAEVIQIALDEGATTINVPDTVGYTMPDEYRAMFEQLYALVPGLKDVTVSVHCHNDLGLAVANSFAGLQAGCRQVECAVNGIGERAGNASLEEIVMLLHTRESSVGLWTGANTEEIARTSRLVSRLTGYQVQPNKAIVGRNAFAHEAGIHQDGVLKERTTYEIMDATTIGLETQLDRAGQALRPPRAAQGAGGAGLPRGRRRAEHRVQALQGDRGPQEEGHGAGPGGDRLRRDAPVHRAASRCESFEIEAGSDRVAVRARARAAARTARSARAASPATARSRRSSAR